MSDAPWDFWVDRGGTFTDLVARAPDGTLRTAKLLSTDPGRYADAAVEAIRRLTGVRDGPLPPLRLRIGTTVATNALLERTGEPTCLAITQGFGDALVIGYQERPDLFARAVRRPPPLHARVVEIAERIAADGEVLVPLDEARARADLRAAHDEGFRALAIVLVHGYRHTAHEARLAEIAAEIGFAQVSVSHREVPLVRLIGRGDTTLADAYLSPVLDRYIAGLRAALGEQAELLFMQSSGGLVAAGAFRGKDAILSGPAGGIVGMAATAAEAGFAHVVGFDMGGTSTDVSHYAGAYERDAETVVAGARIRAPMLRIHTVAAGGGSICRFEDGRFAVGPHSAGAVPGPASYRRGGPLTITDCNVVLGKLQPAFFPRLFGPGGDEPLDADAARARLTELVARSGRDADPRAIAEGLVAIAVADMANAIKRISIARGHDVTRAALACFGGAGGQHACLVADALGIGRVLIHPLAGVLSAYGMGLADRRVLREATLALPLEEAAMPALAAALDRLAGQARDALAGQGVDAAGLRTETRAHVRYAASEHALAVAPDTAAAMRAAFDAAHRARFGYAGEGPLVIDTIAAEAIAGMAAPALPVDLPAEAAPPLAVVEAWLAGGPHPTPVFDRAGLPAGHALDGPALILDPSATTVVEPGWRARVDPGGSLVLERIAARTVAAVAAGAADPVQLEIFAGLFMSVAEEMGTTLQLTARSVNIRERLDFSCALFDAAGNLVANAPHIPVHLGSMGDSIREILRTRGNGADGRGIQPGDVYAINAPYAGGTHLPDITVVMPVFVEDGAAPACFVAARGHHADVGGLTPGSMPPGSTDVRQEGALFDNVLVVEAGRLLEGKVRAVLAAGDWPARNPDQNLADLAAQVAACTRGATELRRLCGDYGPDTVAAYMEHVQDHADRAVRRRLRALSSGCFAYALDGGAEVRVAIEVDAATGAMTVDFAGTSDQLPTNFNAPLSITRAALLYVLRCLVDEPIPLNDGCLRGVTLRVPEGSMLNPRWPAAVVAGNVETSQVVTDALFGALGTIAAAQGTMNNFTFGDEAVQYYETIAGGAGAGPGFGGEHAIQTHMTNSRLTDPEVLETRFPVLLEAFSIRRGSGGTGAWPGGDGTVRRLRFLRPMTANILSNRRVVPPFGLAGGAPGAAGRNRVERADGSIETLGPVAAVEVGAGDVFVIETPGGGGYGRAGAA